MTTARRGANPRFMAKVKKQYKGRVGSKSFTIEKIKVSEKGESHFKYIL